MNRTIDLKLAKRSPRGLVVGLSVWMSSMTLGTTSLAQVPEDDSKPLATTVLPTVIPTAVPGTTPVSTLTELAERNANQDTRSLEDVANPGAPQTAPLTTPASNSETTSSINTNALSQQSASSPFAGGRSAKLPKLPTLAEMTGPNAINANWLKKSEVFSSFSKDSAFGPPLEAVRSADLASGSISEPTNPSLIADSEVCPPTSPGIVFTWAAPNFYSRPLYFEQVNFERYESQCHPLAKPVVSYATFLGTIPILPYKMGGERIHERMYSLGHWRPGDPTPRQIHWGPKSYRGVLYQGAATTGLIFFVP